MIHLEMYGVALHLKLPDPNMRTPTLFRAVHDGVTWTVEITRGNAVINPLINAQVGGLFHWSADLRCDDGAML